MLISFFTPAISFNILGIEELFWMWGLHYQSIPGFGSETIFLPNQEPSQKFSPLYFVSVFPAILILLGSIVLIISGNVVRPNRKSSRNLGNLWIGIGVMLIIVSIIYIIGIDIIVINYTEYFFEETYGYIPVMPDFWDVYNPGFATIAPFIGAVLVIINGVASKKIKPGEEPLRIVEKTGFITKATPTPLTTLKPTPTSVPTINQINFCPECGQNINLKGSKFCMNCGFELKF